MLQKPTQQRRRGSFFLFLLVLVASFASGSASSAAIPSRSLPLGNHSHIPESEHLRTKAETAKDAPTRTKPSAKPKSSASHSSPTLRRLRREWKDLVEEGLAYHWRQQRPMTKGLPRPSHLWMGPLSRNLLVWHFTVAGLASSAFGGGLYHGRIVLPEDYPLHPPSIQVWTPSGRFVPRKDICLSASNFHPETWAPSQWTLRTLVEALRLHFVTAENEIGGLLAEYDERRALAQASRTWICRLRDTDGSVIEINHRRMMEQGLFDGILPELEEEEEAVVRPATSVAVTTSRPHRRRKKRSARPIEPAWAVTWRRIVASPLQFSLVLLGLLFLVLNRPF